jgi:hypothetical protein
LPLFQRSQKQALRGLQVSSGDKGGEFSQKRALVLAWPRWCHLANLSLVAQLPEALLEPIHYALSRRDFSDH